MIADRPSWIGWRLSRPAAPLPGLKLRIGELRRLRERFAVLKPMAEAEPGLTLNLEPQEAQIATICGISQRQISESYAKNSRTFDSTKLQGATNGFFVTVIRA